MSERRLKKFFANFNQKIGHKLIVPVILICALQMITSLVIYGISYEERKEEIIEENIRILEQANSNYLSMIISEMENSTRDLFYDEVFWNTDHSEELSGRIYSILAAKMNSIVEVNSIYLFCSKTDKMYIMDEASFLGIPVTTNKSDAAYGYEELSCKSWFQAAQEKRGKMAVTRDYKMEDQQESIVSFSRYLKYPLKGSDDSYAVSINIDNSFFAKMEKQVCESDELLLLFDDSGTCMYSGQLEEQLDSIRAISQKDKDRFSIDLSGIRFIGIENTSNVHAWTMIKLIPEENILKNIKANMVLNCLIIFIIFCAGLLLLRKNIRKITVPIENLAEAMRNYQQGIVFQDKEMLVRQDEIGILYQSYEKMHERIEQLIESEYKSQILEKEARLEALQAQIDPHFLYNTLQTVSGIAIEKNVYEIEEINNFLSRMLRYSLNKQKRLVHLSEEIENIRSYMGIQKYRYGDRIHLEIELSEEIQKHLVPVFTLQLAVENAMKHGLEMKIGNGLIRIYDERLSDTVRMICVEDNGIGITEKRRKEMEDLLRGYREDSMGNAYDGKGLLNLNERLKQQFGYKYGIELKNNEEQGASLIIYIP